MSIISTPLSYGEGFELNRFSSQAASLVGWWPLGAYPHVTDKSLYRNDGASEVGCTGTLCSSYTPRAASPVSHGQRRALLFDASSKDIVQVPTNRLYGGGGWPEVEEPSRSVCCWVLCNTKASNSMGFVSNSTSGVGGQPGWMLGRTGSSDYFQWWSDGTWHPDGTVTGTTNFSTGVWYHLVGTHDGTTVKLYVNGIVEDTSSWTHWQTSTQPLTFGKWYSNYDCCYLDGLLDDVRLYRRALGANEVAAIYNQTKDGGYGELAAKPQRFYNIPFSAAEPEPVRTPPVEVDLVEGPSGKSDVLFEMIPANLRGARGRMTVNSGGINFASAGTKSQVFPASQAAVNKLDNRFVTSTASRLG